MPEDLVEYFSSDDRLIINWVEGENTKPMKKVFPILEYLVDDDIIINIDDDALFPNDFIESRYNDFKTKNAPITSCNNPRYHYVDKSLKIWSCGPGSLFQKKMLNGYKFTPCSSYFMQNGSIDSNGTKLKKYNDIEPMGKNHVYNDKKRMFNILEIRLKSVFGVGFKDSFGINKNVSNETESIEISNSNNINNLDSRVSMLQKIRDGIRNGTIIKEYKPDGTYIWKKVRK